MTSRLTLLLLPALAFSTGAFAAAPDPDQTQVALRHVTRPASPDEARRLLKRIDQAALEACGALPGSLREVKLAVAGSRCWRSSVAEAVAQIDAPLLTAAFGHTVRLAGADAPHPAQ